MSSFLVEMFDSIKDYIILEVLLVHLEDKVDYEEREFLFHFLIGNKFYEKVKFYAVNDFCHVTELDEQANQYVKYYLIDWYNECSVAPKPLTSEQREFLKNYKASFNEFVDICVSAEELKQLPFLQGKINYDELVTNHADDILSKELRPLLTIHDFKVKLSKEQMENYRLRQENRQFHESLSKFYPQHNDSEQQSPSFLPAPLPYDELLAEKERLVTEVWKLLEQRDTATELLKTEQQEKNLLKEENAQLHAKIAELSAQHGNIRQQNRATPEADNIPSERTEKGYLTTIGILHETLLTFSKGIDKEGKPNKPLFPSQSELIKYIENLDIYGQSKSTLEPRFKKAKDQLEETKKKK